MRWQVVRRVGDECDPAEGRLPSCRGRREQGSAWLLHAFMCSWIFGMNDVNERPPRRSVAAISEVVTDVNDVTAVYAADALARGSSARRAALP